MAITIPARQSSRFPGERQAREKRIAKSGYVSPVDCDGCLGNAFGVRLVRGAANLRASFERRAVSDGDGPYRLLGCQRKRIFFPISKRYRSHRLAGARLSLSTRRDFQVVWSLHAAFFLRGAFAEHSFFRGRMRADFL